MKTLLVAIVVIVLGVGGFLLYRNHSYHNRMAECGAIDNGRTIIVSETTRLFINLPREIYPNGTEEVTHGATAGYVSNGGPAGSAFGSEGKPNCWSTYYDFEGDGSVDLNAKSVKLFIPDYSVHFAVTRR